MRRHNSISIRLGYTLGILLLAGAFLVASGCGDNGDEPRTIPRGSFTQPARSSTPLARRPTRTPRFVGPTRTKRPTWRPTPERSVTPSPRTPIVARPTATSALAQPTRTKQPPQTQRPTRTPIPPHPTGTPVGGGSCHNGCHDGMPEQPGCRDNGCHQEGIPRMRRLRTPRTPIGVRCLRSTVKFGEIP